MRWMHISDIHMNKEFNNIISNILRKELLPFIKDNKLEVDYLFITGDYRDSAYMQDSSLEEDLFEQALNVAQYIQKLAEALCVSPDCIYLVPGNHDLNRQPDDKKQIEQIKHSYPKFRQSLMEQEQNYLLKRFKFFDIIENAIHPIDNDECRSRHRFYKGDKVDILCLNTALTCYGQEKEGELIVDSEYVSRIVDNTKLPLIVLAHHDFRFLIPEDVENLKFIVKNRKVFYLCGHSHKLEYNYDDESNIYKIMVGTTKYAEGAYPIISIGNISDKGELLYLKFYQYNVKDKTGWNLCGDSLYTVSKNRIGFIGKNINKDTNTDFDIVQLPLKQTTSATQDQRSDTLKILAKIKSELCILERKQTIIVSANGLPVNAGIIIGYALHKRQGIQLQYKNQDVLFSSIGEKRLIQFEEKADSENLSFEKQVSLYVYIQAKSRDDGSAAFNEYLRKKKSGNRDILMFINKENYDEPFNLELSAEKLVDRIIKHYEMLRENGVKKIKVHLFYNGFWGLALFLGNQMPTTFPVQLYDYEAMDQQYHKSFNLGPEIFDP